MRTRSNQRWVYAVAILLAIFVPAAHAQTRVDQGQPGKQGPWPVTVSGGSGTITVVVGPATVMKVTNTNVLNSASTSLLGAQAANRVGMLIKNSGPNSIWCNSTTAVVGSGVEIGAGQVLYLGVSPAVAVQCRAATADQVNGANTSITELSSS